MSEQEHTQPEAYTSNCHPLPFGEKIIEGASTPELMEYYKNFPDYEVVLSYELWRTGRNEDLYELANRGIFSQEEGVTQLALKGINVDENDLLYFKLEWTGANMICEFGISKEEYCAFVSDLLSIILKSYAKRSLKDEVLTPDCGTVQHRASRIMAHIQTKINSAYSGYN
jgi:hypothetical protein